MPSGRGSRGFGRLSRCEPRLGMLGCGRGRGRVACRRWTSARRGRLVPEDEGWPSSSESLRIQLGNTVSFVLPDQIEHSLAGVPLPGLQTRPTCAVRRTIRAVADLLSFAPPAHSTSLCTSSRRLRWPHWLTRAPTAAVQARQPRPTLSRHPGVAGVPPVKDFTPRPLRALAARAGHPSAAALYHSTANSPCRARNSPAHSLVSWSSERLSSALFLATAQPRVNPHIPTTTLSSTRAWLLHTRWTRTPTWRRRSRSNPPLRARETSMAPMPSRRTASSGT
ncbi:hypothetical protein AAT19DRAFT_9318 [Rhodotorula toruloides]|uniref:Uncharacterized protein n=1 Tax=Rhodotorula toruloides TaxID=5286 RepID=A0A2T0A1V1_RHOTO|nr:hypothetical protein AAT19DRAFT_9318 [Rhodotorula toruloides]